MFSESLANLVHQIVKNPSTREELLKKENAFSASNNELKALRIIFSGQANTIPPSEVQIYW